MVIHIVYAGRGLYDSRVSFILERMEKYKIRLVMVTIISMYRWHLVTKEKMENYCLGKEDRKKSVNDDLESLFEHLQHNEKAKGFISTYFLPKLTPEELELVSRKDSNYMETFIRLFDSDVEEIEMKLSESNAKFVIVRSARRTITLENPLA